MLERKEFYKEVEKRVAAFLPKEYRSSAVSVMENPKNNGPMTAIVIRPEGVDAIPLIYLESYYDRYRDGEKMEDLLQHLADSYTDAVQFRAKMRLPKMDRESLEGHLRLRLVNTKTNPGMLANAVNRPAGCGFSLVVYIDLESMSGFQGMIQVSDTMAKSMGYGEEKEVFAQAMEDSVAHIPAVMNRIEDTVFRIGTEDGPEDLFQSETLPVSGRGMYVLTNSEGAYGASALFYPGVKERVSEVIGGDYYVLPSSIHEVLILKDMPDLDPKELVQMVKEVNETQVAPLDRLADRVMHYRSDLRQLEVTADLGKERDNGKER